MIDILCFIAILPTTHPLISLAPSLLTIGRRPRENRLEGPSAEIVDGLEQNLVLREGPQVPQVDPQVRRVVPLSLGPVVRICRRVQFPDLTWK